MVFNFIPLLLGEICYKGTLSSLIYLYYASRDLVIPFSIKWSGILGFPSLFLGMTLSSLICSLLMTSCCSPRCQSPKFVCSKEFFIYFVWLWDWRWMWRNPELWHRLFQSNVRRIRLLRFLLSLLLPTLRSIWVFQSVMEGRGLNTSSLLGIELLVV